jgi:cyanophycinase
MNPRALNHGPLALVGSGEYLPSMLEIERSLIDGRPPRYVQIPTAASRESAARMAYWVNLGKAQAERLGVEAVPLVVKGRDQANDSDVVEQVSGAGLIYLSGGDPGHLADVLRDTALWRAVVAAWEGGAALAGCSAGAMVMAAHIPDLRHPRGDGRAGLNLLPALQVLPHFDKMAGRIPDFLTRPFLRRRDGVTLVGVDEETALIGGPDHFVVAGRGAAWILGDGGRQRIGPGEKLTLDGAAP